ncbi:MAG: SPOR domain-containing protein [Bacteroidetes bacterium]|nr:MAG: SPOR domain-containing protein [Bacteroidota bacterium]
MNTNFLYFVGMFIRLQRLLVILTCFLLAACCVHAQDTIAIKKDARIDVLVAKQITANRIAAKMSSNGQFKGYRLQVLNTKNRDEAFGLKSLLLQQFPDQKSYVVFQSPYFKVRFGNFLKLQEAEDYRKIFEQKLQRGVYVMQDLIEYTLKEEDLN